MGGEVHAGEQRFATSLGPELIEKQQLGLAARNGVNQAAAHTVVVAILVPFGLGHTIHLALARICRMVRPVALPLRDF